MFDCPDASHTSPARMSCTTMRSSAPDTVSVCGPPAGSGENARRHRPVESAVVDAERASSFTVTRARGGAHPHTGIVTSRCTTM